MTSEEAVQAVLDWIAQVVPEVAESRYDYLPLEKPLALPDVVAELGNERVAIDDPAFPFSRIQQAQLRVWTIGASFMVNAGESAGEAQAATRELRDMAERLVQGVLADATLGERVQMASPLVGIDYTPAFVQYGGGTRGREMTLELSVGELIQEAE